MISTIEVIFKMQIAMCEGWARFMMSGFTAYERFLEHQALLMEQHHVGRLANSIPKGADWFDHYGKRIHDVNVERV